MANRSQTGVDLGIAACLRNRCDGERAGWRSSASRSLYYTGLQWWEAGEFPPYVSRMSPIRVGSPVPRKAMNPSKMAP